MASKRHVTLTSEQVKKEFHRTGKTVTQWAAENGYTPQGVYRVLNGQVKANYGKGHEIAVKLGMKPASQLAA